MLDLLFVSKGEKFILQSACVLLPVTVDKRQILEFTPKLRGPINASADGRNSINSNLASKRQKRFAVFMRK